MKRIQRDNIPHLLFCLKRLSLKGGSTLMARLTARWWGVTLSPGCTFIGRVKFHRHPRSRMTIGANCRFNSAHTANLVGIDRPCTLSTLMEGACMEIGPGCGFSGTVIGCASHIVLGKNVRCGANTLITDTDWHWDDPRTSADKPVRIESNVWLGVNATVLKGVSIGENTLVGAGSLVTRSLPADVIAAGVPARVIRKLSSGEKSDADEGIPEQWRPYAHTGA